MNWWNVSLFFRCFDPQLRSLYELVRRFTVFQVFWPSAAVSLWTDDTFHCFSGVLTLSCGLSMNWWDVSLFFRCFDPQLRSLYELMKRFTVFQVFWPSAAVSLWTDKTFHCFSGVLTLSCGLSMNWWNVSLFFRCFDPQLRSLYELVRRFTVFQVFWPSAAVSLWTDDTFHCFSGVLTLSCGLSMNWWNVSLFFRCFDPQLRSLYELMIRFTVFQVFWPSAAVSLWTDDTFHCFSGVLTLSCGLSMNWWNVSLFFRCFDPQLRSLYELVRRFTVFQVFWPSAAVSLWTDDTFHCFSGVLTLSCGLSMNWWDVSLFFRCFDPQLRSLYELMKRFTVFQVFWPSAAVSLWTDKTFHCFSGVLILSCGLSMNWWDVSLFFRCFDPQLRSLYELMIRFTVFQVFLPSAAVSLWTDETFHCFSGVLTLSCGLSMNWWYVSLFFRCFDPQLRSLYELMKRFTVFQVFWPSAAVSLWTDDTFHCFSGVLTLSCGLSMNWWHVSLFFRCFDPQLRFLYELMIRFTAFQVFWPSAAVSLWTDETFHCFSGVLTLSCGPSMNWWYVSLFFRCFDPQLRCLYELVRRFTVFQVFWPSAAVSLWTDETFHCFSGVLNLSCGLSMNWWHVSLFSMCFDPQLRSLYKLVIRFTVFQVFWPSAAVSLWTDDTFHCFSGVLTLSCGLSMNWWHVSLFFRCFDPQLWSLYELMIRFTVFQVFWPSAAVPLWIDDTFHCFSGVLTLSCGPSMNWWYVSLFFRCFDPQLRSLYELMRRFTVFQVFWPSAAISLWTDDTFHCFSGVLTLSCGLSMNWWNVSLFFRCFDPQLWSLYELMTRFTVFQVFWPSAAISLWTDDTFHCFSGVLTLSCDLSMNWWYVSLFFRCFDPQLRSLYELMTRFTVFQVFWSSAAVPLWTDETFHCFSGVLTLSCGLSMNWWNVSLFFRCFDPQLWSLYELMICFTVFQVFWPSAAISLWNVSLFFRCFDPQLRYLYELMICFTVFQVFWPSAAVSLWTDDTFHCFSGVLTLSCGPSMNWWHVSLFFRCFDPQLWSLYELMKRFTVFQVFWPSAAVPLWIDDTFHCFSGVLTLSCGLSMNWWHVSLFFRCFDPQLRSLYELMTRFTVFQVFWPSAAVSLWTDDTFHCFPCVLTLSCGLSINWWYVSLFFRCFDPQLRSLYELMTRFTVFQVFWPSAAVSLWTDDTFHCFSGVLTLSCGLSMNWWYVSLFFRCFDPQLRSLYELMTRFTVFQVFWPSAAVPLWIDDTFHCFSGVLILSCGPSMNWWDVSLFFRCFDPQLRSLYELMTRFTVFQVFWPSAVVSLWTDETFHCFSGVLTLSCGLSMNWWHVSLFFRCFDPQLRSLYELMIRFTVFQVFWPSAAISLWTDDTFHCFSGVLTLSCGLSMNWWHVSLFFRCFDPQLRSLYELMKRFTVFQVFWPSAVVSLWTDETFHCFSGVLTLSCGLSMNWWYVSLFFRCFDPQLRSLYETFHCFSGVLTLSCGTSMNWWYVSLFFRCFDPQLRSLYELMTRFTVFQVFWPSAAVPLWTDDTFHCFSGVLTLSCGLSMNWWNVSLFFRCFDPQLRSLYELMIRFTVFQVFWPSAAVSLWTDDTFHCFPCVLTLSCGPSMNWWDVSLFFRCFDPQLRSLYELMIRFTVFQVFWPSAADSLWTGETFHCFSGVLTLSCGLSMNWWHVSLFFRCFDPQLRSLYELMTRFTVFQVFWPSAVVSLWTDDTFHCFSGVLTLSCGLSMNWWDVSLFFRCFDPQLRSLYELVRRFTVFQVFWPSAVVSLWTDDTFHCFSGVLILSCGLSMNWWNVSLFFRCFDPQLWSLYELMKRFTVFQVFWPSAAVFLWTDDTFHCFSGVLTLSCGLSMNWWYVSLFFRCFDPQLRSLYELMIRFTVFQVFWPSAAVFLWTDDTFHCFSGVLTLSCGLSMNWWNNSLFFRCFDPQLRSLYELMIRFTVFQVFWPSAAVSLWTDETFHCFSGVLILSCGPSMNWWDVSLFFRCFDPQLQSLYELMIRFTVFQVFWSSAAVSLWTDETFHCFSGVLTLSCGPSMNWWNVSLFFRCFDPQLRSFYELMIRFTVFPVFWPSAAVFLWTDDTFHCFSGVLTLSCGPSMNWWHVSLFFRCFDPQLRSFYELMIRFTVFPVFWPSAAVPLWIDDTFHCFSGVLTLSCGPSMNWWNVSLFFPVFWSSAAVPLWTDETFHCFSGVLTLSCGLSMNWWNVSLFFRCFDPQLRSLYELMKRFTVFLVFWPPAAISLWNVSLFFRCLTLSCDLSMNWWHVSLFSGVLTLSCGLSMNWWDVSLFFRCFDPQLRSLYELMRRFTVFQVFWSSAGISLWTDERFTVFQVFWPSAAVSLWTDETFHCFSGVLTLSCGLSMNWWDVSLFFRCFDPQLRSLYELMTRFTVFHVFWSSAAVSLWTDETFHCFPCVLTLSCGLSMNWWYVLLFFRCFDPQLRSLYELMTRFTVFPVFWPSAAISLWTDDTFHCFSGVLTLSCGLSINWWDVSLFFRCFDPQLRSLYELMIRFTVFQVFWPSAAISLWTDDTFHCFSGVLTLSCDLSMNWWDVSLFFRCFDPQLGSLYELMKRFTVFQVFWPSAAVSLWTDETFHCFSGVLTLSCGPSMNWWHVSLFLRCFDPLLRSLHELMIRFTVFQVFWPSAAVSLWTDDTFHCFSGVLTLSCGPSMNWWDVSLFSMCFDPQLRSLYELMIRFTVFQVFWSSAAVSLWTDDTFHCFSGVLTLSCGLSMNWWHVSLFFRCFDPQLRSLYELMRRFTVFQVFWSSAAVPLWTDETFHCFSGVLILSCGPSMNWWDVSLFFRCFDPQLRSLYELIREGSLGDIVSIKSCSRDPARMLSDGYFLSAGNDMS